MNTPQPLFRGLLWKEIRLVLPLILMLLGVTLLLITLWSMFQYSSRTLETAGRYIPLILPALYAAGTGAILIGQERENRTLWWFTSLPISATRIFWTKALVALAGLVVMWVCCAVLALLGGFDGMPFSDNRDSPLTDVAFWYMNSVFVTACGIFTAWRFRNTFASLIAILPLAVLPFLTIQFAYSVREVVVGRSMVPSMQTAFITLGATVAAIVLMTWLAYRAGLKTLLPAEPEPVYEFRNDAAWRDAWRPSAPLPSPSTSPMMPFGYSLSSLVWQSIHHNMLALLGLVSLLVASLCWMFLSLGGFVSHSGDQQLLSSHFAVGLVACWLGVFAFTGDGSAARLRFLADRGVSPTVAWLGRQLIGISLLSLTIVLYAALTIWTVRMHNAEASLLPSIAMVALLLWTLYGVSQWTSQLFRIVAAAVVIAPILAGVVVYWLGFAATELQAPLWLVVVCSSIPMFATWMAMRQFMDDGSQLRSWLCSAPAIVALVVLPMLPAAWTVATWPSMPSDTRAALMAEAEQAYRTTMKPQSMMQKESPFLDAQRRMSLSGEYGIPGNSAFQLAEQYSFSPADRLQLGETTSDVSVSLAVDAGILENALAIATYQVMLFEAAPDDQSKIDALGEWIQTLTLITKRLRQSPRWRDQEAADVVEIWLTQMLSKDSLKLLSDRPFSIAAREMLADGEARNRYRRRAVLASWYDELESQGRGNRAGNPSGFESYDWIPDLTVTMKRYVASRNIDAIVDRALRLLAAGDQGQSTEALRRELHCLTCSATIAFEDGSYSDRLRAGGSSGDTISIRQTITYPANQWHAAWEADAKRLIP